MTDNEIKQNALKAEKEHGNFNYQYQGEAFNKGYIAGAHSRDEEVKELKEEIESLQEQYKTCFDGFVKRGTKLGELMKENVKLRNPWISVEERLPENYVEVIGMTERGWVLLIWRNDNEWCGEEYRDLLCPDITHWMPIPQIKKG